MLFNGGDWRLLRQWSWCWGGVACAKIVLQKIVLQVTEGKRMEQRRPVRYPRVKLLLIFAAFAAPIVTAWTMLTWQIGMPSEDTAHGQVHVSVPALDDWPLSAQPEKNDAWTL